MEDFEIPDHLLVARVKGACIFSPTSRRVDMPIQSNGYVGMVDRDVFDEWLRERAKSSGALRIDGTFVSLTRDAAGVAVVSYRNKGSDGPAAIRSLRAKCIIGADGALSAVARQAIPRAGRVSHVFAYHEVIRIPADQPDRSVEPSATYDRLRCDIIYKGSLSPDFYAWIFPHGETASVGTGSARKGFSLKDAVRNLRINSGLDGAETIRKEGAPIPLRPLKKWDNGRDVVLAGDAAGVVAPASGEGIFYAMTGGRLAADAVDQFFVTGDVRALASARKRFMRDHGRVFWVLAIMQRFWYRNDRSRERFVSMCSDCDVQRLTWEAYMRKKLVRQAPFAHVRIFFKDMAHLLGLVAP
jgi:geranylgeranyl reductase